MAERITLDRLKRVIQTLAATTGQSYGLDQAYGGVKLTDAGGGRELSMRLTKSELYEQCWFAIQIIRDMQNGRG